MKRHLAAFLVLAALCGAVYGRSVGFSFNFDDSLVISANDFISSPVNLRSLFSRDYFLISGEQTYRPAATVSYYVDHVFWKLNPAGYHLTNVVIHVLAAAALYAVCVGVLGGFGFPLLAASLFAVHPVNVEAVVSPGFREDLLAGLFYFAGVALFLKARHAERRAGFLWGLCAVSYMLALFSKEMALSFPLVLIVLAWVLPRQKAKHASAFGWAAVAGVTLFYLAVRFVVFTNPAAVPAKYPGGSLWTSALTTARVFLSYVKALWVPAGLSVDYAVAPSGPADPWGIGAGIVLIGLLGLGVWGARRWRAAGLGILWFLITLLPVSNIIPIYNVRADRYLYIPSAGFCLMLVGVGMELSRRARVALGKRLPLYVISAMAAGFAVVAGLRAMDWRSPLTLWSHVLAKNPDSFRGHMNLAHGFFELQRYDEAIEHYQRAHALSPEEPMVNNNMGVVLERLGRPDLAVEKFREALALWPGYYRAQVNLAVAEARMGAWEEAEGALAKAAGMRPVSAAAYARLGSAALGRGEPERAQSYLKTALTIDPGDPLAHDTMGRLLLLKGDAEGAVREHLEALRRAPKSFEGYLNLGNAYRAEGNRPEAEKAYRRAAELNPTYWKAYYNLGVLDGEAGESARAVEFYKAALSNSPYDLTIYKALGELLLKSGRAEEAARLYEQAVKLLPNSAEAFLLLGQARAAASDAQGAAEAYTRALELAPEGAAGEDLREKAQAGLGEPGVQPGTPAPAD